MGNAARGLPPRFSSRSRCYRTSDRHRTQRREQATVFRRAAAPRMPRLRNAELRDRSTRRLLRSIALPSRERQRRSALSDDARRPNGRSRRVVSESAQAPVSPALAVPNPRRCCSAPPRRRPCRRGVLAAAKSPRLRSEGKAAEADRELEAFRRAYPPHSGASLATPPSAVETRLELRPFFAPHRLSEQLR